MRETLGGKIVEPFAVLVRRAKRYPFHSFANLYCPSGWQMTISKYLVIFPEF
jgi:hypothetical protein